MAYEFFCRDAGAVSCGGHIKADSEEDMKAKLLDHVDKKHGVSEGNDTLVDYLLTKVTSTEQGAKKKDLKF